MMTAAATVLYQKEGSIAWVTLNRPQVLNAYNLDMRDELYTTLEAVRDDPEVRGMVLCGAGDRAFCAGADLTEFGSAPSQAIARQVRWERDVWGLFLSITKPIIAALHGYVLGSGLEMALLCDMRIASDDAVFGLPETVLGMIPAAGGTQTTSRTIGVASALELLLTGRRFSAQEAFSKGLINRIVPRAPLLSETLATLESVLAANQQALETVKAVIHRGLDLPLDKALNLETRVAASSLVSQGGNVQTWQSPVQ